MRREMYPCLIMQVIEAQRASILEPRDHLHISHERTFAAGFMRTDRPPDLGHILASG